MKSLNIEDNTEHQTLKKTNDGLFKKVNRLLSESDELNKQLREMSDDVIYNLKVINVLFIALFLQNILFWLIR